MAYRVKWRAKTKGVDGRDGYFMFAERESGAEVAIGETKKVSGGFEFRGDMLAEPVFRRIMRELQEALAADPDVAAFVAGRGGAPASGAAPGDAPAPGRDRVPMTADGYRRLEEELKKLKSEDRPAVIRAISEAREHGDLSENAEYHAARERQGFIEGRMREIEDKIGRAHVIDVSKLSGDTVTFGATVTLVDEDTEVERTWQIVGADESDVESGRLSIAAPLARAIMNRVVGDSVTVEAPQGARNYEILSIEFR